MKRFATLQTLKGEIVVALDKCPRCGKFKLIAPPNQALNSLSRVKNEYICNECGTKEALNDYFGKEKKIR